MVLPSQLPDTQSAILTTNIELGQRCKSFVSIDTESSEQHDAEASGSRVILKRHHGIVLLRYWVHLFALAITIAVSHVNLAGYYFTDSDDPSINTTLNAFQFAAKLHEVVVVASLTLIITEWVRDCLTSQEGISLGYILAPVLFTQSKWLVTAEFWQTVKFRSIRSVTSTVLIVTAVVFALLAGPLSAILFVPRQGWSAADPATIYSLYFNTSSSNFWPPEVNAGILPEQCFTTAAATTSFCPANAVQHGRVVLDSMSNQRALCRTHNHEVSCNITMNTTTHSLINKYLSVNFDEASSRSTASAPSANIFDNLANYLDTGLARDGFIYSSKILVVDPYKEQLLTASLAGGDNIYKPVVTTQCDLLDSAQIEQVIRLENLNVTWSQSETWWLNNSADQRLLLTFLENSPSIYNSRPCQADDCQAAISCSINASWIPQVLWYNNQQSSLLYQSEPSPQDLSRYPIQGSRPITLDTHWLQQLENGVSFADTAIWLLNQWGAPINNQTHVYPTQDSFVQLLPSNFAQGTSVILSSFVANALAHVRYDVRGGMCDNFCANNTSGPFYLPRICQPGIDLASKVSLLHDLDEGYTKMNFSIRRLGYGWFLDPITVKIALAVMLLHATLVMVYLFAVLVFKKTMISEWKTATEILVLAINSVYCPRLELSQSGKYDGKIWRESVTVREVEGTDRLSLVVGNIDQYEGLVGKRIEIGKKYS